jgi:hypothetical protein
MAKTETRPPDESLIKYMQKIADQCGRALGICSERPLSTGEKTYGGIPLRPSRMVVYDYLKKKFPHALEVELARGTGARAVSRELRDGPREPALVEMLQRAEKRGDLKAEGRS